MTGPRQTAAEQQRGPGPGEAPGGEPGAVRIWLLGGFRVSVGSRTIGEDEWRLKKAQSLIKLLALAPGHRLHREQAMELLWPDLEAEAAFPGLFDGKIAFSSNRTTGTGVDNPTGDYEIFTMNPNGTGLKQLTKNDVFDFEPVWSADGKKIAFVLFLAGNVEVYTMEADGDNQTNLTNNAAADLDPDWQPITQIIIP